jgi:hypothetical protein
MTPRRRCYLCREFGSVVKVGGRRVCVPCRPIAIEQFRADMEKHRQAMEDARLADIEASMKPSIFDRERIILGWMREA